MIFFKCSNICCCNFCCCCGRCCCCYYYNTISQGNILINPKRERKTCRWKVVWTGQFFYVFFFISAIEYIFSLKYLQYSIRVHTTTFANQLTLLQVEGGRSIPTHNLFTIEIQSLRKKKAKNSETCH
jgi:hypothetical protein